MTIKIKEKGSKRDFLQVNNFGKGTTTISIEVLGKRNEIYLSDRQITNLRKFFDELKYGNKQ
jgi:hypothetical protein